MRVENLESSKFDSQFLFFENYQENNLIKIRNDLKTSFENIDQEIFLSSWRKSNGYIPDGFKSRTIRTIYGPVTFKRRVYKYWDQSRYHYVFLADKKLEIEKYNRVTNHLKFKILEQIASGKRQRDICDMFSYTNLTRATISNIIKLFHFQDSVKDLAKNVVKVKIAKYLYISMDETFLKLRRNNKMCKFRIRLVTFHTGYNKIYSTENRKVLANKRVYYQILPIAKKIDTVKFMDNLKRVAKKFYSNVDEAKIIIGGDGAAWIREAKYFWPNSDYILDKFHAVRQLKQLFANTSSQDNYQNSKDLFNSGKYHELMTKLKEAPIKPEKEQKLAKVITYFSNNVFGVSNQSLQWNIGVSIEGDVSHIVKWLLGYGSKALNFQTFRNMLFLKSSEINKIDVINFLKKQDHLKKEAIKDFYWNSCWINKIITRHSLSQN